MGATDVVAFTSNFEPVPSAFYVYVDTANVLANHNVGLLDRIPSTTLSVVATDPQLWDTYLRGDLDYRPFIDGPNGLEPNPQATGALSAHTISSLERGSYTLELVGERVRSQCARQAPSRLSAVYAFGDLESSRAAGKAHGWDQSEVTEFKLQAIPGTKVWRVNMEIVSVLDGLAEGGELDTRTTRKLWSAYWEGSDGKGVLSKNQQPLVERVIWEFLIEGTLQKT